MTIDWKGALATAVGICVFLGPFAYKTRRSHGASHVRAALTVALLFVILVFWIVGVSNALYGIGIVVDEPPQIIGLDAIDEGHSHWEHIKVPYLLVGVASMVAGWLIGKVAELMDD